MDDVRARLAGWRARGLITIDQEEAIAAHEAGSDPAAADRRLVESLAYVGAVLFLAGGLILAFDVGVPDDFLVGLDDRWDSFWVALAVAAVLGLGAYALDGRAVHDTTRRGVALTALGAFVAFVVAEIILVTGIIDLGRSSVLVVGLAMLAVAYPLYRWTPGAPTHLALAAAGVVTISGFISAVFDTEEIIGSVFGFFEPGTGVFVTAGLLFLAFGLGWMHLADRRLLVPRNLGYVLGALVAFFGAQLLTGIARWWIVVTLAVGLGLVVAGIARGRTILMALGTYGLAFGLSDVLNQIFDTDRSVGVTLAAVGAAVFVVAVVRAGSLGEQAATTGAR